uniref:Uncharacterized protein n=1 Tax=Arundo donax TaxID=35708 RepID=A0A0A9HTH6_ARUDO
MKVDLATKTWSCKKCIGDVAGRQI